MRRVCEKLHSRRGASLLYALALLLVTATVSTVVLTSAVTANRRVHDDRQEEQNYLALFSAAKLIVKSLKDSECVVREEVEEISPGAISRNPGKTSIGFLPSDPSNPSTGAFGPALEEIVLRFWKGDETSDTITVTVDVSDVSDDKNVRDTLGGVEAEFTIQYNGTGTPGTNVPGYMEPTDGIFGTYPIQGYLTIGSGTEQQKLYLSASSENGLSDSRSFEYTKTGVITEWRSVLDPNGIETEKEFEIGEKGVYTYTLKWTNVSLSTYPPKGGES